jgi:hypothetical protein
VAPATEPGIGESRLPPVVALVIFLGLKVASWPGP